MATRREDLAAALDAAVGEPTEVQPVEQTQPEPQEGRLRDEAGRFAAKQPTPEAGTPAAPAPEAVAAQPATEVQRLEAPKSWKAEMRASWEKLDPQIAAYVNQREQEMSRGVEEIRQRSEPAMQLYQEVSPYLEQAKQRGMTPQQFVADAKDMFYTRDLLLNSDPQTKLQTVVNIAHAAGIPLAQMLQGQISPEMQQQMQAQFNPAFQTLQQRLQSMESTLAQQQQIEQTRSQQEIDQQIQAFAQAPDHPYFNELMPEMARLLQSGVVSDLDGAYRLALRSNDELFEKHMAQQRQASEQQNRTAADKAAKAAKANAVSVRSATPGAVAATTSGAPKGRRAALSEAFDSMTTSRV